MLAVLVVLGGAAAALYFSQPQAEDAQESSLASSSSAVTEKVMDRKAEEIASISVENQEGGFRMVPQSGSEDSFTLEGYESYDINTSQVTVSAESLLSLTPLKVLGERKDLEEFGLSGDSAVNVTLQYQDGGEDQLVLGSLGGESAGRYMLKDGCVYIVPGISTHFYGDVFRFFNTDLYTIPDRTEDKENSEGETTQEKAEDLLERASFSGTQFPENIEVDGDVNRTSTYLITAPVRAESGTTYFGDMVTALKTLSVDKAVAIAETPEELDKFGLKEPFAQIDFRLNGEDHILAVSEKDSEGNRCLLADNTGVVYSVPADTVSSWAEATLLDLRMSYIWLANIMDVKRLSLTTEDGTEYVYDITRTPKEESSSSGAAQQKSYDLSVKNKDGKDIQYENYREFYQQMISVAVLSSEKTEFSGEPAFQMEYRYFENDAADVVGFYPVGADRYVATLNGEFNGLVRKTEVEKLAQTLVDLDAGKTVEYLF